MREAHFTSSALGDQSGLLCGVCVWPQFCQTYTEQRQGDHAFTAWCFDRNIQILRVFPVFGPVSSATYASYLRIEGSRKRSHFTVFGPVSSAIYTSYLRIEGSRKRSHFTVFGSVSSATYTSYLRIEGSRKGFSFDIGRFAPLLCRVLSSIEVLN